MPHKLLSVLRHQTLGAVALFVALSGTSYAVATGSIDGREIKNNTIRSSDIRNDQVRGKDIRDGSVRGNDVGNDSLGGDDILEGRLGRVPAAEAALKAGIAGTAGRARTAIQADNSARLDGTLASGFLRRTQRIFQTPSGGSYDHVENYRHGGAVATMGLPSGDHLVLAQVAIDNDADITEPEWCTLDVPGTANDRSQAVLPGLGAGANNWNWSDELPVTVSTAFTGEGNVALRCANSGGDNDAKQISIIAVLLS